MQDIFQAQREAFQRHGAPAYDCRLKALRCLHRLLKARKHKLAHALSEDFGGRSHYETLLLEIFPTLDAIRHAQQNLKSWMNPRPVSTGWFYLPARARIEYQPLGVVGIIGAWNYPLFVTLAPMVDALAAGNHVMIKPSELTPCLSSQLRHALESEFSPEQVAVITGGPDTGAEFAALPFDHLVFTGSARVGKLVMRAASANLTPVTLELGGKSPALVHESYPVRPAMHRILKGKLYNAGQTCLAPDYLLVHRSRLDACIQAAEDMIPRFYPKLVGNPDYTRIINTAHYERLLALVQDAQARGAAVRTLNPAREDCSAANRVYPPTLITGVEDSMQIAQEEIFGPILPILAYSRIEEALDRINAAPRPLAFYYFDNSPDRARWALSRTHSGTAAVNDVVYQIGPHELPFGGVGSSGMGRYRGVHGFETFSNKRSVFVQSRLTALDRVHPPYGKAVEWLVRLFT